MSAANALLQAIDAALRADAALMAMTGGRGLVDRLGERAALPLVALGEMESREDDTGTEKGEEHLFSLVVWSEAEGRQEAETLAACIRDRLDDADLTLEGAVLVTLFHRATRTRREPKSRRFTATLTFRAVTERP